MVGGSNSQLAEAMVLGPWTSLFGSKKMGNMLQRPNHEDLMYLSELLKDGQLKPIIDRCYTLSEVLDAFRYFDGGHARGKVVITM